MDNISRICEKFNVQPRTVVEVGPSKPEEVRSKHFIEQGIKTILVEPNLRLYSQLALASAHFPNVTVLNAAIVDQAQTVRLFERGPSSFVEGITSPAKINDGYVENIQDSYEVAGVPISIIDNRTIDVLLADVEGSEWFCVKNLVSRPKIIILELFGWSYVNPYISEIENWMKQNGYRMEDRDSTDVLFTNT